MNRRAFLRAAGVAGLGSIAGCTGLSGVSSPGTYQNPVFEPVFADPSVIRSDDGTFYAYGTSDNWHDGKGLRRAPIVRSSNLVDWEYVGEALQSFPDWKDAGNIWAPDIAKYNGKYLYYYSVSKWGDPNPGIGVATANSPEGPFTDHGKLFRSDEIGVPNSIDPMFLVDGGTPYLFWGSFHGIWGVELTADGLDYKEGTTFNIAGSFFEAPYIHKRNGKYYFFGSMGSCCSGKKSTYRVAVARSDSLKGPYKNKIGDEITSYPGSVILKKNDAFVGPGHNSMITDDAGTDWMLYHAYEREKYWLGNTPRRPLMLDPIVWKDGWPTVEGQSPSTKHTRPVIE